MIGRHPLRLSGLLVSLLAVGFYLTLVTTSPSGIADADEITLAAYFLRPAHPPGFPWQTFSLGLLMRLLPRLLPAFIANLYSAGFMALTMGILAAVNLQLFRLLKTTDLRFSDTQALWLAATAAPLLLAGSSLFLTYAVVAEIFSLGLFLSALTLFLALTFALANQPKSLTRWWCLTWIMAAITLTQLPTFILFYPILGLIFVLKWYQLGAVKLSRLRLICIGLGLWCLSLIFTGLLLWFLALQPARSTWAITPTINGVFKHFFRADYSGHFAETSLSRPAFSLTLPPLSLPVMKQYFSYLYQALTPLVSFLLLLGLTFSLFLESKLKWLLWLAFFISCLFWGLYLRLPQGSPTDTWYLLDLAVSHRQYLIGWLSFSPFLALALWFIFYQCRRFQRSAIFFSLILYLSLISWLWLNQFRQHLWLKQPFQSLYATEALTTALSNSLIICTSDLACYSLMAAHHLLGIRPDVTVVPNTYPYVKSLLTIQPDLYPFRQTANPALTLNLIKANLSRRPVYLTGPSAYYIQALGLNGDPYFLIPDGWLYHVALAPPPALPPFKASSLDQQLTQSSPTSTAPWYNGYRLYLAALHRLTAELAFNYANQPLFRYHLEQAQTLNPNDPVTQALSQRSFPSNPLSPYQSH